MNNPYGLGGTPSYGNPTQPSYGTSGGAIPLFGQTVAHPITGQPVVPGAPPAAPTSAAIYNPMEAAGSFGDIGGKSGGSPAGSHGGTAPGAVGTPGGATPADHDPTASVGAHMGSMMDTGFSTHSAAPSGYAIGQAFGVDPGLVGMVPGLIGGPVGTALSAMNTVGNVANTIGNHNMLGTLGTSPSFGQTVGGLLGMNNLAGSYTGALSMAMADKMPGFQGIEIAQPPGDYGPSYGGSPTASPADVMAGYGPGAVSQADLAAPAGYAGSTGYGGGGTGDPAGDPGAGPGGNTGGDHSGGADVGGAAADANAGGWSKGGKVTQNRLSGPNPTGPDTGFGALKAGEFVMNNAAVKRLGLKKLNLMNRKGTN